MTTRILPFVLSFNKHNTCNINKLFHISFNSNKSSFSSTNTRFIRVFSTYMDNSSSTLVSAQWLSENLSNKNVKVVDASWQMPNEIKDIYADYNKVRIPGAVLFDIDAIADKSTNLPHMLPSEKVFSTEVGKLGISNDDVVVAYDSSGKFVASARVWWTFRAFGHKNIKVLDGGLPKWLKLGLPTESGKSAQPKEATYTANLNKELVKDFDQIRSNIEDKKFELVDARPADRFFGRAPEPRPGLRSGYIPGSKSIPWVTVLDMNNQTFLKKEDILSTFKSKDVDVKTPIITTCGSGVTASVLSLGLHLCGIDSAVYDGSFSEWGQPQLANKAPVNAEAKQQ